MKLTKLSVRIRFVIDPNDDEPNNRLIAELDSTLYSPVTVVVSVMIVNEPSVLKISSFNSQSACFEPIVLSLNPVVFFFLNFHLPTPEKRPSIVMLSKGSSKFAVMLLFASIIMSSGLSPPEASPDHPVKTNSSFSVAVIETSAFSG